MKRIGPRVGLQPSWSGSIFRSTSCQAGVISGAISSSPGGRGIVQTAVGPVQKVGGVSLLSAGLRQFDTLSNRKV